jgi:fucose permease
VKRGAAVTRSARAPVAATLLSLAALLVMAVNIQVFPSLLGRVGGSPVQLGLLLSSLFLLYPLACAGSGWVSDRFGKKPVLAAGALMIAVSFGAAAPFASPWARIAAVVLFGAGAGVLEGQSSALLADVHPGRERSMLNLSQLFYCIGATGGPALISLALVLRPSLSVGAFLAAASGAGLLLFFGFLALRDRRTTAPATAPMSFLALARNPEWRLLAVSLFLYVAAEMGIAGWAPQFAREVLGVREAMAPIALALFWGGSGLARILAVFFPTAVPARPLLLGGVALTLAGQVAAFTLHNPVLSIAALTLSGIGMGPVWPTLVSIAGVRFRDSTGMAVGMLIAAGAVAVPLVQPLIGLLSQAAGLRIALLSLSAATLANLFLVSRVRETRPAAPG